MTRSARPSLGDSSAAAGCEPGAAGPGRDTRAHVPRENVQLKDVDTALPDDWAERDCFGSWRLGIELARAAVARGEAVPGWLTRGVR